jgi:hypothetical protein
MLALTAMGGDCSSSTPVRCLDRYLADAVQTAQDGTRQVTESADSCLPAVPTAINRHPGGENFLYVFKGARGAPGSADRRSWCAPRRTALTQTRRSSCRSLGGFSGGTLRAWAPPAALRPFGPRRRRRASPPRDPPHWLGAATISARRASCKSGPSSERSSVQLRKVHSPGRPREVGLHPSPR